MSECPIPAPLQAFPRISQWLEFSPSGRVHLKSGRVELGQGIATALTQIAAEELDLPVTAFDLTLGHTEVSPGEGPTVGSMSVSFGGQSVRMVASAARVVFLEHAAQMLKTMPHVLSVLEGAILKDGIQTGLSYKSLAAEVNLDVDAAPISAPKPAALRTVAGTSVARVDLAARMGSGYLVHDMQLPSMLHGRVIQPPSLTAEFKRLPAVKPPAWLVQNGRFLAVVAEDEYTALQEANRIAAEIDWHDDGPVQMHPVEGLDDDIRESEILYDAETLDLGSREVSLSVTKPVLSHGSIGPSCAVAQWQGEDLTVWAHSQNVVALRASLARVLQIDIVRITVIFAPGSGCYGHNSSDDVALDAALMAQGAGAPVRALWQREDEFLHAPLSPAMRTHVIARLDDAGKIVSYHAHVISPTHSTRPGGADEPNLRAQQFLLNAMPMGPGNDAPPPQGGADRNAYPGYVLGPVGVLRSRPMHVPYRHSAMRGLGAFTNVIAIEALMETCAEIAGQDSTLYRLAHLADPRARAVTQQARAMSGDWQSSDSVGYGLGYARYKYSAGYTACVARIEVDGEVHLTDVWTVADVGEAVNPDGTINQIEGGIVQSIGWVLKEEITFSGGKNLTRSWEDYSILRFSEVPRMLTKLIGPQEDVPLGAGEISVGPAGAAVVNAVRQVFGVTPTRLPLNRHNLMSLLS